MVRYLCEHGADVNAHDQVSVRDHFWCVGARGDVSIVCCLLPADFLIFQWGCTIAHKAAHVGDVAVMRYLRSDRGVPMNAAMIHGVEALRLLHSSLLIVYM